ncbi:DUF1805 domain-containing protein [Candidatus Micrarchaeota archaeon]|nr:DUF1805 domain-containing protein [Candidatus Micrarchaeota archaeon]
MSRVLSQIITLSGKSFSAIRLQLDGCALLAIVSDSKPWVWLACGYVDVSRAEKWSHSLGIVTGVDSFDDMLNAQIKAVSRRAEKEGAAVGMRGRHYLELLG